MEVTSLFWILQPLQSSLSEQQPFCSFLHCSIYCSKDSLCKLQLLFEQLSPKKYKALFKDGAGELSVCSAQPVGRENKSDCFTLGPINRYLWYLMQFFYKLVLCCHPGERPRDKGTYQREARKKKKCHLHFQILM